MGLDYKKCQFQWNLNYMPKSLRKRHAQCELYLYTQASTRKGPWRSLSTDCFWTSRTQINSAYNKTQHRGSAKVVRVEICWKVKRLETGTGVWMIALASLLSGKSNLEPSRGFLLLLSWNFSCLERARDRKPSYITKNESSKSVKGSEAALWFMPAPAAALFWYLSM